MDEHKSTVNHDTSAEDRGENESMLEKAIEQADGLVLGPEVAKVASIVDEDVRYLDRIIGQGRAASLALEQVRKDYLKAKDERRSGMGVHDIVTDTEEAGTVLRAVDIAEFRDDHKYMVQLGVMFGLEDEIEAARRSLVRMIVSGHTHPQDFGRMIAVFEAFDVRIKTMAAMVRRVEYSCGCTVESDEHEQWCEYKWANEESEDAILICHHMCEYHAMIETDRADALYEEKHQKMWELDQIDETRYVLTEDAEGETDVLEVATDEEWEAFVEKEGFYTAPEFLEEKFTLKTGMISKASAENSLAYRMAIVKAAAAQERGEEE